MAKSVDSDQTAPIVAVCSGSTLFASLLNLSEMLGNYLLQTTSADDIFRCIFLGALRVNPQSTGRLSENQKVKQKPGLIWERCPIFEIKPVPCV